jgi:hypothetical protein
VLVFVACNWFTKLIMYRRGRVLKSWENILLLYRKVFAPISIQCFIQNEFLPVQVSFDPALFSPRDPRSSSNPFPPAMYYLGFLFLFYLEPSLALATPDNMRRILVTGANSGIGLALTKQLIADHGCYVYLGARNAERGMEAVEEVKAVAGKSVELLNIVSDTLHIIGAA